MLTAFLTDILTIAHAHALTLHPHPQPRPPPHPHSHPHPHLRHRKERCMLILVSDVVCDAIEIEVYLEVYLILIVRSVGHCPRG